MSGFVDEVILDVQSGSGGRGSVSFRREKYVPRGGPDGGNGGKGGDVVFVTVNNISTLSHLKGRSLLKAQHGQPGSGRRKHGRNGKDCIIQVPPGTRISRHDIGKMIHDFSPGKENETWIFLRGGRGGLGNWNFRTSTNRVPIYTKPPETGESCRIILELALFADIGFVGMPNAGKSSLLSSVTEAKAKAGDYPFTTRNPQLGLLRSGERELVLADIPGLVKGAASGAGMGHQFLRHISRSTCLVFFGDLGSENPSRDIQILINEVATYDQLLSGKKRLILGSKSDLDIEGKKLDKLKRAFPEDKVMAVSAYSCQGLANFQEVLFQWTKS